MHGTLHGRVKTLEKWTLPVLPKACDRIYALYRYCMFWLVNYLLN